MNVYHPVGSFYINGPSGPYQDKDWVVYVPAEELEKYENWLVNQKFYVTSDYQDGSQFHSWKKLDGTDTINFIVTTDPQFFTKFILAAELCRFLPPMTKTQHIWVHEAIMKGTVAGIEPLNSHHMGCKYLEEKETVPF